ncbi:hypothetical protein LE197_34960 [Pseudomonas sp. PS1(2021)]|uniref:hypothetical protein n=1 Tax=Pseudomonas sp. PS1(2021) TaxID=2866282 RepID=UPI001CF0297E|nr:hypothetical protein [Pseudomonas sp. PS1(2021)]UCM28048.1 hypothetical protein LE197_34960 [Pseudomonas sp. PS1(2021)]
MSQLTLLPSVDSPLMVRDGRGRYRPRVCKNTFLSCVLQPIAPGRGDFPIIYHDQRR